MVVSLPEMDRLNYHKDEAKEKIAMTMAGKAAEIIKWGEEHVSNGPAGDIQQASAIEIGRASCRERVSVLV